MLKNASRLSYCCLCIFFPFVLAVLLLFVYFVYICPCSVVVACLLAYPLFYTDVVAEVGVVVLNAKPGIRITDRAPKLNMNKVFFFGDFWHKF